MALFAVTVGLGVGVALPVAVLVGSGEVSVATDEDLVGSGINDAIGVGTTTSGAGTSGLGVGVIGINGFVGAGSSGGVVLTGTTGCALPEPVVPSPGATVPFPSVPAGVHPATPLDMIGTRPVGQVIALAAPALPSVMSPDTGRAIATPSTFAKNAPCFISFSPPISDTFGLYLVYRLKTFIYRVGEVIVPLS